MHILLFLFINYKARYKFLFLHVFKGGMSGLAISGLMVSGFVLTPFTRDILTSAWLYAYSRMPLAKFHRPRWLTQVHADWGGGGGGGGGPCPIVWTPMLTQASYQCLSSIEDDQIGTCMAGHTKNGSRPRKIYILSSSEARTYS